MTAQRGAGRGRRRSVTAVAIGTVAVLLAGACSSTSGQESGGADDARELSTSAEVAEFTATGSVNQVTVVDAPKDTDIALYDADGEAVEVGTTDDRGAFIFRQVEAGDGYRVANLEGEQTATEAVEVLDPEDSLPEQSFYDDQELKPGYQYITTRDGTTLAASVYLPGPVEDGPYPTVVEYSGYNPAAPGSNLLEEHAEALKPIVGDDLDGLCAAVPFACNAPAQPGSMLALAMGYAVVSVNMRGTGCSGGAYDYFEPLQVLDGYDVIETAAAQPWVKGGKVGMVGLSYPGISQLFVASAQPPHLAAITPLSVFDDTARGVLAPGGIFNEGFALSWAREVLEKAEPYGQGWEKKQIEGGDETCEANQQLRGQNVDVVAKARSYDHYAPEVADPLNPSLFAKDIEVPVFLTGAYQDEQTGGRFPMLFDDFTNAPVVHFSAWNGAHGDGFAPFNLVEWKTFLDLYVAGELTEIPGVINIFAPILMEEIFGASVALPPSRFTAGEDVAAARARYEAEPPIRLVFESGAGDPDQPGAPDPSFETRVDSFPPAGTKAVAYYLQPDGTLSTEKPTEDGESASRFTFDPELAKTPTLPGDDVNDAFKADVKYAWDQEPDGSATVFVSEPLQEDLVLVGSASADLWLRTDADDADVGVTLSEVRPDGKETYIQSGLLRASMREVAEGSTELLPLHTGLESDTEPMPEGEFEQVRIEVFPFGHILRAGSRLRLSVHTPGGDRPRWTYITKDYPEGTTIDVGHSAELPSRLVLPVTSGITGYPEGLPPCPGLRGQACRTFAEYENTPAP